MLRTVVRRISDRSVDHIPAMEVRVPGMTEGGKVGGIKHSSMAGRQGAMAVALQLYRRLVTCRHA